MTDTKKSFVQDVLGSLLFVVGAFLAFSISMFWLEGGARDNPNFSTSIVLWAIDLAGQTMAFVFGLTSAILGGVFFFSPGRISVLRHGGGALGVWIGATLVFGAAASEGAGALGGLFGTLLGPSALTAATSALVGLFVVAATVWGVWVPRSHGISTKLGEPNPVSAALREGDEGGVTSAEAAALLPLDENEEPIVPAHPIDVRLAGGIPEGTSPILSESQQEPIDGTHESQDHTEAGNVAAAVDDRGADAVDEDLAATAIGTAGIGDEPQSGSSLQPPVGSEAPAPVGKAVEAAAPLTTPISPTTLEGLPRPSWESAPEDDVDEAAPAAFLSEQVLEPLSESPTEPATAAPADSPGEFTIRSEPEFPWDESEASSSGAETAPAPVADSIEQTNETEVSAAKPVEDAAEESNVENESELEADVEEAPEELAEAVDEEVDDADDEADDEVDDDEVDDDEEYEEEDEEYEEDESEGEDEDGAEADEEDEEWEYEDEEEDEELDEDDPEAEYEEWEEEEDEEYEEGEEDDEGEEYEEDEEDEEDEDLAEAEGEIVRADGNPEAPEEDAESAKEATPDEPETVVQPAAPKPKRSSRRARRDAKSKGEVPDAGVEREELLHRAGLMIIERDRVAVSMFQREFDLSFQDATILLDELQQRGLIGPYLGGRHRDILLTREQWEAKAPSS